MTNTETFANSLDRLIFPFIEMILEGEVVPDKCQTDHNFVHDWESPVGQLSVRWETDEQENNWATTVHWCEELVYRRENGRTTLLRPGAWVRAVYDTASTQRAGQESDDLDDAIKSAVEKNINFEPFDPTAQ